MDVGNFKNVKPFYECFRVCLFVLGSVYVRPAKRVGLRSAVVRNCLVVFRWRNRQSSGGN